MAEIDVTAEAEGTGTVEAVGGGAGEDDTAATMETEGFGRTVRAIGAPANPASASRATKPAT